jgi:glycosyltransferase involved in cell wall biosynthesis
MPLVSVVIPTFNRVKYVKEAIDSVLKQTYDDFEIIVVDDGSIDETSRVLEQYGDKIRVFYQKRKGASAARNLGIAKSNSEFIAFLDSDDLFYKKKLEIQLNEIKSDEEIHICYTNEKWILNSEHKNQHAKHKKYSGWIFEKSLPLCIVSASSAVIRREVFENCGIFDEKFIVCEDYELWLRLSLHYPFHFIDKPLIIKRGGHPDQLSHKYWGMDRFRIRALEKTLETQNLSDYQKELVVEKIKEKAGIISAGALKRKNIKVYNYYKNIVEKYSEDEIFQNSNR